MLAEATNSFWFAAAAIVVAGCAFGLKDILRFSPVRLWAVSGIAYVESVRKRVLWVAPAAMIGVILVSQLQHPVDEQDAIRQTIKFCIFAAGLVVSLMAIILASTNLPKEIENRVIYSIVTKPATRLEIVAGKVVGFARVSAAILAIMGLLTWGYLTVRSYALQRQIAARLERNDPYDSVSRATNQHYAEAGLLHAKTYVGPRALQMYSRMPVPGESRRWLFSLGEQDLIVPFRIDPSLSEKVASKGVFIRAVIQYEKSLGDDKPTPPPTPSTNRFVITAGPSTTQPARDPRVLFSALDEDRDNLIASGQVVNYERLKNRQNAEGWPISLIGTSASQPALAYIPPGVAHRLLEHPLFFIRMEGGVEFEYAVDNTSFELVLPGDAPNSFGATIKPLGEPILRGRYSGSGRQIRGDSTLHGAIAIYSFDKTPLASGEQKMPMELRVIIERDYNKARRDTEDPTQLDVQVVSRSGGQPYSTRVVPESGRIAYFNLPGNVVADGNFDVIIRCVSDGHWVAFTPHGLQAVVQNHSFVVNLFKSLLILWLLSVLITALAVLSSTFLSWPIAFILTLVMLTGHWSMNQLGDSTYGIGRQVATELGFQDAGESHVVSTSIETLTSTMRKLSSALPDISRFSAMEDIERGVNIPPATMWEAIEALLQFVIPLVLLAYVILRFKEVAP